MRSFDLRPMTVAYALLSLPLGLLCANEPGPVGIEAVSSTANVKLRPGEFKLLRSSSRVVRVATSNPEVCSAVVYDGQTFAIWGRAGGTSDVTVWLENRSAPPVVWVVSVK